MSFFNCTHCGDDQYTFDLDDVVQGLKDERRKWRTDHHRLSEKGGRRMPSPPVLDEAMDLLRGALFPMRLGPDDLTVSHEDFYVGYTIGRALNMLLSQVRLEIVYQNRGQKLDEKTIMDQAFEIVSKFSRQLPKIRGLLDDDVHAAYRGDPAADSVDEILLCYPGIYAMCYHRVSHELYSLGVPLAARVIAELAHSKTGIDIHPGAQIGPGCFIDHGTGVVIGETAILGKNVRIYQAVTLGAKSFEADEDGNLHKGILRHPIVEDDVVIYSNATVLGRITIGQGAVIGGNVWVTKDVPAGSFVSQSGIKSKAQSGL
ncbi:serine O-acetyltransferase EpsC [Brackiella oedipodis]|uniref:serine O-acetyltransferase EpsC n=1 Tax=Brackiella oedipodis TaxID=124225 RepID=UPI0006841305|nr:serine O-acetyltransferase EpsC [Brackiella oedipodis]